MAVIDCSIYIICISIPYQSYAEVKKGNHCNCKASKGEHWQINKSTSKFYTNYPPNYYLILSL